MKLSVVSCLLLLIIISSTTVKGQSIAELQADQQLFAKEYPEEYTGEIPYGLKSAGDINGDGFMDFYTTYRGPDYSTADPYDDRNVIKVYTAGAGIFQNEGIVIQQTSTVPFLKPAGDLNGDSCEDYFSLNSEVVFNNNCDAFSDTSTTPLELDSDLAGAPVNGAYTTGIDVNGDGIDDTILHQTEQGSDRDLTFGVLFGDENPDSVSVSKYTVPVTLDDDNGTERTYSSAYIIGDDLNDDNNSELIVMAYSSSYNLPNSDLLVLSLNSEAEFEVAFSHNIEIDDLAEAEQLVAGNYTGTDNNDLFLTTAHKQNVVFEIGVQDSTYSLDGQVNMTGQFEWPLNPVGDLDADGLDDFYTVAQEGEGAYIPAFVYNRGNLNSLETTEFNSEGTLSFNNNQSIKAAQGYSGDLTNDGKADILLSKYTQANDIVSGKGSLVVTANDEGTPELYREEFVNEPQTQVPAATFHAGDFNGDGNEDVGIQFRNSVLGDTDSRVSIFYGGTGIQAGEEADLTISGEQDMRLSFPAAGDFNGDGITDLVINEEGNQGGLNFYWGGQNADAVADHRIDFLDVLEQDSLGFDTKGFSVTANIGDVNMDGVDDLAYSSNYYSSGGVRLNNWYIVYGGTGITGTYDLKLEGYKPNISGIGDIDGDGKYEIMVARPDANWVEIYESFDEEAGESFDSNSEYTLTLPSNLTGNLYLTGFGNLSTTGDFNGDGTVDLALGSIIHTNGGGRTGYNGYIREGGDAVFIYYGGSGFDEEFDHSFKIPVEPIMTRTIEENNLRNGTAYSYLSSGEISRVPDQNGDGTDELLYGTGPEGSYTNALIFNGDADSLAVGDTVLYTLKAENQNVSLGSDNYSYEYAVAHSAVGDFNSDGKTDIYLPQSDDENLAFDPVLKFRLDATSVSTEIDNSDEYSFTLHENYPNPFNPVTTIGFHLPEAQDITLEVFDITGRKVGTLLNRKIQAGEHEVTFNAANISSGVYFYRLSSEEYSMIKKMTLIK